MRNACDLLFFINLDGAQTNYEVLTKILFTIDQKMVSKLLKKYT